MVSVLTRTMWIFLFYFWTLENWIDISVIINTVKLNKTYFKTITGTETEENKIETMKGYNFD